MSLSTGVCLFVGVVLAPLFGLALALENRILIAALVMLTLIPLVIRWPVASTFGLYVFLVPFDSVASLAGGATLTRLVGILAGGVMLAAGVIEHRLGRPPAAAVWWSLFMIWGALSMAWAINPDMVRGRLPTAASLIILYVVAISIRPTRKELYWICMLAVAGGVAAAAVGYVFGIEGSGGPGTRGRLVVGEQAANPNGLAASLILPLALATAGIVGLRNPLQKLLAVGALALIGVGVFITQSRAGLVAIIVTVLVFVCRVRIRWQVMVPIAVLLAMVVILPDTFFTRAEKMFSGEDSTGAGRTRIWAAGIKALEHVGIFGAGLSNYEEIYQFSDAFSPGVWEKGSHNTFLGAWVELGIIGLVLMLAALASHFLAARGLRRFGLDGVLVSAIEAGCVGIMAVSFFGERLWTKVFWVPWILLVWAVYVARDTERARSAPS
jgi:O-antigen ligase